MRVSIEKFNVTYERLLRKNAKVNTKAGGEGSEMRKQEINK